MNEKNQQVSDEQIDALIRSGLWQDEQPLTADEEKLADAAFARAMAKIDRKAKRQKRRTVLRVFDRVMARRSGHRFNLMLMRRDALQSYASWLFPLLDAAEIDTTGYSARDKRVHGFLAERLLDVWLAQQDYRVKELPVAHLERQHWGRKIAAFLLRKMGIKNDRTAR